MNFNDRRLDRVSTGLSSRQRAVMRVRAFKEDAPEPSGLYRSTPDYQIPEVNDLLALANATHREITWYAVWLQARTEIITVRGSVVAALHLATLTSTESLDPRLSELAEAITGTIAGELCTTWAELLALDEVVLEVTGQFDGEEPLHPDVRALLDETKESVLALAKDLPPPFADLVLPTEPSPQVRKALAAIIEQEARLL